MYALYSLACLNTFFVLKRINRVMSIPVCASLDAFGHIQQVFGRYLNERSYVAQNQVQESKQQSGTMTHTLALFEELSNNYIRIHGCS